MMGPYSRPIFVKYLHTDPLLWFGAFWYLLVFFALVVRRGDLRSRLQTGAPSKDGCIAPQ